MPTAIRGIVFDFRLRTADFVHNMKSINRQLRNLNRLSRRADRELKINPNSYKAFNSHLQVAQARLTSASQKLALYRAELLKLQLNTKTATSRIVNAKNRVAEWSDEVRLASLQVKKLQLQLNNFQADRMIKVGSRISSTLLAPLFKLGFAGGLASREFVSLEKSLGKVATIAKDVYDYERLRDVIQQISVETGIASKEVGEGWYFALSSGGLDATKSMTKELNFMITATKLNKAGFGEMNQTVKLLAQTLNAYGISYERVEEAADKFIKTQNSGILTVDEMSQYLAKVIPTAANVEVSLDQVTAAMATLTQAGQPVSRATTYLNRLLVDLIKTSTNVSKVLKEKTGKTFRELQKDGVHLGEIIALVGEAADETNQEFIEMFSSIRAGQGGLGIFVQDGEVFARNLEKISSSSGELNKAFEQMNRFYGIPDFINKLRVALQKLGRGFLEGIKPLINFINTMVDGFLKIDGSLESVGKAIGQLFTVFLAVFTSSIILKGVGLLTKGITTLSTIISSLVVAVPKLATAFGFLSKAAGPIAIVITSLGVLYTKSEAVRKVINSLLDVVVTVFGWIGKLLDTITTIMGKLIDGIATATGFLTTNNDSVNTKTSALIPAENKGLYQDYSAPKEINISIDQPSYTAEELAAELGNIIIGT